MSDKTGCCWSGPGAGPGADEETHACRLYSQSRIRLSPPKFFRLVSVIYAILALLLVSASLVVVIYSVSVLSAYDANDCIVI